MPAPTSSTPPASLAEVRTRIDAIDTTLIHLLTQRQALVRAAATFKPDAKAVHAPDRVEQVITSVRERSQETGLDPEVAEAVWRAMINAFIKLELTHHTQPDHNDQTTAV